MRSTRCCKRCGGGLHANRPQAAPGRDLLRRARGRDGPSRRLDGRPERRRYRLERREDDALFAHNVGPNSWKSHLFPATLTLWKARRSEDGALEVEEKRGEQRYAFIGVRSCDLHAIAVQDRTFLEGAWADRDYQARRAGAFIVAVNCARPAARASASQWARARAPGRASTSP